MMQDKLSATLLERTRFNNMPVIAVAGLVIISTFLFLFLYQPFGEVRHNFTLSGIVRISSYAIVSGLTVLVFEIVFGSILRAGGNEKNRLFTDIAHYGLMWWVLTLVIFLCKNYWMNFSAVSWADYWVVVYRVSAIAVIPLLLLLALGLWFRSNQVNAKSALTEPSPLLFKSAGRNPEYLRLSPDAVVAITSEENYVLVHYDRGAIVKSKMLRNTLANVESQLELPFMRIHRSTIVNLDRVVSVSGNSQGLKLKLTGMPGELAVSRKYLAAFKDAWQTHPGCS